MLKNQQEIEKDSLFATCALIGNNIYAFTSFKRLPITVNLQKEEIGLLDNLQNYDSLFVADFMINLGDDIFVLELDGNRLLRYNIDERVCQYIYIGCHNRSWGNYAVFAGYGDCLYIVPKYLDELIRVDIKSGKMERKKNLFSKLNIPVLQSEQLENFIYFGYGYQYRNIIWFFREKSNLVVAFDIEQDVWRKYELSMEINDCVHAIQYNGMLYILSSEGKIYRWDMKGKTVEIWADCSQKSKENNIFIRIAVTDKNIWLLPALGEDIFCIDFDTRQPCKYVSYPKEIRYCGLKGWSKYYGYCEDEEYYYFAMRYTNAILSLNKQSGKERWIRFRWLEYKKYIDEYIKDNKKLLCEGECKIEDIWDYSVDNYSSRKQKNEYGNLIWEKMKSARR